MKRPSAQWPIISLGIPPTDKETARFPAPKRLMRGPRMGWFSRSSRGYKEKSELGRRQTVAVNGGVFVVDRNKEIALSVSRGIEAGDGGEMAFSVSSSAYQFPLPLAKLFTRQLYEFEI